MATISLHTKLSGHQPGTDIDKLYLPVPPIVACLAIKNLKQMVSTSTVALISKNEEKRITYRFYLLAKKVEQMIYSMNLNGKLYYLFLMFYK